MRKTRALLVLSLWAGSFGCWVAGCGSDDSSNPATQESSSSGNASGSSSGNTSGSSSGGSSGDTGVTPEAPVAKASNVTVYLGNVAKVDATQSTGAPTLSYAWKVNTVPAGSTVTTTSLATPNAVTTTFRPDKIGAYELEVTVSSSAATQTSKATVTVTVVDPPVFYFDTYQDASTSGAQLVVNGTTAQSDAGKPVACFERDSGSYDNAVLNAARSGADWWEAPAGQASKAAFLMESAFDGGQVVGLFSVTSTGSCAQAPTKLDLIAPSSANHTFEQPRISPDGSRVAYVRQGPEGARVATIGMDGTNMRLLSPRGALPDGGGDPDAGLGTNPQSRPFWVNNTSVAWIESLSGNAWQVVKTNDAANATREIVMQCTGNLPAQGALLGTGEVLVAQDVTGGTLLIAYPIDATTKQCNTGRVLTPYVDGGGMTATDFSVSPDGTEVAYSVLETRPDASAENYQEMRVVKVSGTSPPRKATTLVSSTRGARWTGSGAFLTWQMPSGAAGDAGQDGGVIIAVTSDGGIISGFPANGSKIQSIGNGMCDIGHAAGSGVAAFGMGVVFALRLIRRRRR